MPELCCVAVQWAHAAAVPAFRGLLQMPASLRATAEDCLAHPYLQALEQANHAGQPAAALVRCLAAVQRRGLRFHWLLLLPWADRQLGDPKIACPTQMG